MKINYNWHTFSFSKLYFFILLKKKMFDKLIQIISQKVALNENDIKLCSTYFEPISYPKNCIVEEQEKIPEYLYFIVSGFMRLFYYDENGDENTNQINTPNDFVASYLSLIQGTPAKENLECITDCNLFRIKKQDFKDFVGLSENFKSFSLLIFENAMAKIQIRANDLATLNAEQRYRKLLENQADVLQNVPIQYIASYLGMKPESLSRIRKNMIN
jgi:CRP/FNR family transcriptional regulator, anaerobic regulatory protein